MVLSTNPLVSIIVPTYNRGLLIMNTINSILIQSYKNFELIIVDDGSTDNTTEIINGINDSRIIYNKIINSGGPAKPRNIGLKQSKGDYIAFCDDDDIWKEHKLKYCVNELINGSDFVYHNFITTGGNFNNLLFRSINSRELIYPYYFDLLNNGNSIINSSVVFKKDLFFKVGYIDEDTNLVAAEDYDYWLRISLISKKMTLIKNYLGIYNISYKSISRNSAKIFNYTSYLKKKYKITEEPIWMLYNLFKISTIKKNREMSKLYFNKLKNSEIDMLSKFKIYLIKFIYIK